MSDYGIGTPYWYEWEIGLLQCLEMMFDNQIESVTLQSSDFESLDDVVIKYKNNKIKNIQVKHTDADNHFTYSTLTSGSPSMLKTWAKEWKNKKNDFDISEISIITNKLWGKNCTQGKCSFADFVEKVLPELKNDYQFQGSNIRENKSIIWLKNNIGFLGNDASEFVKVLSFAQENDLSCLDKKIEKYIIKILGTKEKQIVDIAKNSLIAELKTWATSERKKQEINREDVYKTLCINSIEVSKYNLYPESPIFPSRIDFARGFEQKITSTDKKIIFLQGLPGSGKTNFVSYLANCENSIVDFRFYTYIPVNKTYCSFSDDEGYYTGKWLWRCILHQLKIKFEELGILYEIEFPLIYNYLSVTEMREYALKYLQIYTEKTDDYCYLFIDGLDHAARSKNVRDTFLYQLPRPDEISEKLKFILVGQPLNENYPSWIINNAQIEYVQLPEIQERDVRVILQSENININNIDVSTLSNSIISVVGNNALNVLFAIYEIKEIDDNVTFDEIVKILKQKKLCDQIYKYYEWILSSLDDSLLILKIKVIFSFCSHKVSAAEIADICGAQEDEITFILGKFYPMIIKDDEHYYVFHNDVRVYLKNATIINSSFKSIAISIMDNINNSSRLYSCKYDILFGMLHELDDIRYILDLFSPEYIINSVQYGITANKLINQFGLIATDVLKCKQISFLNKISTAASAIFQYIKCIRWNEKENTFLDNPYLDGKVKSEKYILDINKDANCIITDIYNLIRNDYIDRSNEVYNNYFSNFSLSELLSINFDDDKRYDYGEKCGYICRHLSKNIIFDEICDEYYTPFLKGWLAASENFLLPKEIDETFVFKKYSPELIHNYIDKVCKKDIPKDTIDKLSELLIYNNKVDISSTIILVTKSIMLSGADEKLSKVLLQRAQELKTENVLEYSSQKIIYVFMLYFCVYPYVDNKKIIDELHTDILEISHNKKGDRGYQPSKDQFIIADNIFSTFYSENYSFERERETFFDCVYFNKKYGAGALSDCDAPRIRSFLLKILYNSIIKKNSTEVYKKVCDDLIYVFTNDKSIYIKELAPIFWLANEKEEFKKIADFWTGRKGIVWDKEYDDVEYYCEGIIPVLNLFEMYSEIDEINKLKLFKIFGYTGRKDYSISDLLEYYKLLPISEDKLLDSGMKLLTVSNLAEKIGDNRLSNQVDNEMFGVALELGIKYVDALFEIKNTPEDFLYWRFCLLDCFFEKIQIMSDADLLDLYSIVNSWINIEIEKSNNRYNSKYDYLQNFNKKIIDCIKDGTIRSKLINFGNCTPPNLHENTENIKEQENSTIDLYLQDGYNEEAKEKIIDYFLRGDNREVGYLIELVNQIPDEASINDFVERCIVKYIVKNNRYGFSGLGLESLISTYGKYFSDDAWLDIYNNIIEKITTNDIDMFYSVSDDLEILCRYYFVNKNSEKLKEVFDEKIAMHWSLLTSCGLIDRKFLELQIDNDINSLSDFKKKQIGICN